MNGEFQSNNVTRLTFNGDIGNLAPEVDIWKGIRTAPKRNINSSFKLLHLASTWKEPGFLTSRVE